MLCWHRDEFNPTALGLSFHGRHDRQFSIHPSTNDQLGSSPGEKHPKTAGYIEGRYD